MFGSDDLKGLFYRDFVSCKKHYLLISLNLLGWILLFAVMLPLLTGDIPSCLVFGFGYLIMTVSEISLVSFDEKGKWNNFGFSLPYTRWQAVQEKYLLNLGMLAFCLLVTFLVHAVRAKGNEYDWLLIFAVAGASLIFAGTELLLVFRFDVKTAMYLLLLFPILSAWSNFAEKNHYFVPGAVSEFLLHWMWLVGAVYFAVTYFLSCKALENREL